MPEKPGIGMALGKLSSSQLSVQLRTTRGQKRLDNRRRGRLVCGLWAIVTVVGVLTCFSETKRLLLERATSGVSDGPDEVVSRSNLQVEQQGNKKSISQRQPVTVGYAISLVKCGDHQSTSAGLVDAALIMQHSVHMTSVRNPDSGSKYDYKMYAIVHRDAQECSKVLNTAGFDILIVDPPVKQADIRGEYLRKSIHREWCCGADEFIKLYAYVIDQPIVVHVDIDFAFIKPMDELYDAMYYTHDSPEGIAARSLIPLERPGETMPDRIDAFLTRDWPQVIPGRKAGFQAGFIVLRPDASVVKEASEIILEGNYTEGYTHGNGWGGLGYGGFVGARAMQGLMAYFYDHVRPGTSVELNQCRYNWMGMDTRYRHNPNFRRGSPKAGKCRNDLDYCEDCMAVDLDLVKNVHYTQCRKPWSCIGVGASGGSKGQAIDTDSGNYEQCMKVVHRWHQYRADFEEKLYRLTGDEQILNGTKADYKPNIFMGHCGGEGKDNYYPLDGKPESFALVPQLYA